MTLHVIVTVFKRTLPLAGLINNFLRQTKSNWMMHIIHDGPADDDLIELVNSFNDPRIEFNSTPKVNGLWGFPNRNSELKKIPLNHNDFVLITNDDNMYVPTFVEYFLRECKDGVGFVYCNTIHNYMKYDILVSEVRQDFIDMGSFIVKLDVAKRVGFKQIFEQADGAYAVACANYCRIKKMNVVKINKCLYIHN
jgi:hypothetical protein